MKYYKRKNGLSIIFRPNCPLLFLLVHHRYNIAQTKHHLDLYIFLGYLLQETLLDKDILQNHYILHFLFHNRRSSSSIIKEHYLLFFCINILYYSISYTKNFLSRKFVKFFITKVCSKPYNLYPK